MLLLIDNFDSFTYNIAHAFSELGETVCILRNTVAATEVFRFDPDYLVIGPGPGTPADAGVSTLCLQNYMNKIPILGICLGHQIIGTFFGAELIRANFPMHGKTSPVKHNSVGLFSGLPQNFSATRYHSLLLSRQNFPTTLTITAKTEKGEILGIEHKEMAIFGLQFHPESLLTEYGSRLLENFMAHQ